LSSVSIVSLQLSKNAEAKNKSRYLIFIIKIFK
jgi:hypothetical protein